MKSKVYIKSIFNCSLERAFKTPMLCDITKVHTGYFIFPRVSHCTEDRDWGKPGFSKKVYTDSSMIFKAGYASDDTVLVREENQYWKIEVSNFQQYMFGFSKFIGEWKTTELESQKIQIVYSYELHSKVLLLYPINWLFAKTIWKTYMRRVMENIRIMTIEKESYLYN